MKDTDQTPDEYNASVRSLSLDGLVPFPEERECCGHALAWDDCNCPKSDCPCTDA